MLSSVVLSDQCKYTDIDLLCLTYHSSHILTNLSLITTICHLLAAQAQWFGKSLTQWVTLKSSLHLCLVISLVYLSNCLVYLCDYLVYLWNTFDIYLVHVCICIEMFGICLVYDWYMFGIWLVYFWYMFGIVYFTCNVMNAL